MSTEEIKRRIPHRGAMLLVDEIVTETVTDEEQSIICRKTFHVDEFFFDGHFPDSPIVPGVIQCECCLQAGAVLLARPTDENSGTEHLPVATRIDAVKFKKMIHPGDTAEIHVQLNERISSAYYMTGKVKVGGKLAARLDFTVTMTAVNPASGSSAEGATK